MGNENDGGPYSAEWSRDQGQAVDASRRKLENRDLWILETRDACLSEDELRRKKFLIARKARYG